MGETGESVSIEDGRARVRIEPSCGGSIAAYDLIEGGAPEAVFRPVAPGSRNVIDMAFPLVPWSNRISGGGFSFEGRFHPIAKNYPTIDLPIHGNGWLEPWTVEKRSREAATVALDSGGPGPFRYRCTFRYALEDGALTVAMTVTNRAAIRLPYGIGFHPWFPRDADTRIAAPAEAVWLADAQTMPVERVAPATVPYMDLASSRALGSELIDNEFEGWGGKARILWPRRRLAVDIAASGNLSRYVVYTTGPDCGFVCFEPVSHMIDAHNLAGGPEAHGLALLAPGETLEASCRFTPRRTG